MDRAVPVVTKRNTNKMEGIVNVQQQELVIIGMHRGRRDEQKGLSVLATSARTEND